MASLQAVRLALAKQIQDNAFPRLQALGNPQDQINPPCALILPPHGTFAKYGETLGGAVLDPVSGNPYAASSFNLDALVVIARNADIERVQETLDQWFGYEQVPGVTVSIPMAVAMDDTLGHLVQWCQPTTADAYAPVSYNEVMYFGARIHFTIGLV